MKFTSPTEHPIHLALTSGHTCVIGLVPVEVDARFHRMAVAEGAIPEGFEKSKAPDLHPAKSNDDMVIEGIRTMMERDHDGDFINDGRPNATALSAIVGFTVTSSQRDAAWNAISAES